MCVREFKMTLFGLTITYHFSMDSSLVIDCIEMVRELFCGLGGITTTGLYIRSPAYTHTLTYTHAFVLQSDVPPATFIRYNVR